MDIGYRKLECLWLIERRHQDGKWEVALSDHYARYLVKEYPFRIEYRQTPQGRFGEQNQRWFNILSQTEPIVTPTQSAIATKGTPADISAHAKFYMRTASRHFQSYFTIQDMEEALARVRADNFTSMGQEAAKILIEAKLHEAYYIVNDAGPVPCSLDNIIVGDLHNVDTDDFFRKMEGGSNHQRLRREARSRGLLPPGPDTLRFLISYD